MKKMAVIRRLDTKRQQARELTSDVNKFATGMLRNQDLAQVKQDEAYGKVASAAKILNRMAHSGLLRRKAASQRLLHLQQLPYLMTNVSPNLDPSMPNVRGYVSKGYQNLPAYGGPAVSDCGPAGSSSASDTVCGGVPTAVASTMLGQRLHVDESSINAISLNINRLQNLDSKLLVQRAQREYDMQVNVSKGIPIVLSQVDAPYT